MASKIQKIKLSPQKTSIRSAGLCVFVLFLLVLQPVPANANASGKRVIKVGAAVAPQFKAIPGWKEKFKQRLAYASKIFEREAKIKLEPALFWDWQVSEDLNTHELLSELQTNFPLHGADIVIGLTRLSDLPDLSKIGDLDVLGRARPFSGYLLLRYPNNPLFKVQEETVLVHELGHLFGAIHTEDPSSIMAPIVENQIPTSFDNTNREIISLTKNMNFKRGVSELDPRVLQRLLGTYHSLMVYQQPVEFYYSLGIFYLQLGKSEDAVKSWQKALAQDSENATLRKDVGILYYKLGKTKLAIRELSKAVSALNRPGLEKQRGEALKTLGLAYLKEDSALAAYNALSRAAAILPDDPEIQTRLAIIQVKQGNYPEAIRKLTALLGSRPDDLEILSALGEAYLEMGNYRDAEEVYKKAAKRLPNPESNRPLFFEIYSGLGKVYLKMNKQDDALKIFQVTCHADKSAACHKRLGEMYYQMQRWEDASREFTNALYYEKGDPNIYGAFGVTLSQMGRMEEALSAFIEGLKYVRDRDKMAQFHNNIGHIYMQLGHFDMAEREFRDAMAADWKNADSHMGLAMSFVKQNNLAAARRELESVLSLQPGNQAARKLLSEVNAIIEASETGVATIQQRQYGPSGN